NASTVVETTADRMRSRSIIEGDSVASERELVGKEQRSFSAEMIVVGVKQRHIDHRVAPLVVAQVRPRVEHVEAGDHSLHLLNDLPVWRVACVDAGARDGARRPDAAAQAEGAPEALVQAEAELRNLHEDPDLF